MEREPTAQLCLKGTQMGGAGWGGVAPDGEIPEIPARGRDGNRWKEHLSSTLRLLGSVLKAALRTGMDNTPLILPRG